VSSQPEVGAKHMSLIQKVEVTCALFTYGQSNGYVLFFC